MTEVPPLVIFAIGIVAVVGLIVGLRVHAFVALLVAALVVSVLAPGELAGKIGRIASAFGSTAGGAGIPIALAALIGRFLMDSGAADRIVGSIHDRLGERHGAASLMSSGYVLSVPVFFDTVFYLLVPLARSMYRRTGVQYLRYLMAISVGGAVTHTLVPPTPGPLVMADTLSVDVGTMMLIGALIAVPASLCGFAFAGFVDRRMPVEPPSEEDQAPASALTPRSLPSFAAAIAPILVPVLLITTSSILSSAADAEHRARFDGTGVDWPQLRRQIAVDRDHTVRTGEPTPGSRVLEFLPASLAEKLAATGTPLTDSERAQATAGLNSLLLERRFYDYPTFVGKRLSPSARRLLGHDRVRLSVTDVERLNRSLIDSAFSAVTPHSIESPRRTAADWGRVLGHPILALMVAMLLAALVWVRGRRPSRATFQAAVEQALGSAGVVILITAAGGAFGAMLGAAGVGTAVADLFRGETDATGGRGLLFLAFGLASMLKIAQGSSTVAMITAASMIAPNVTGDLGFHPVYLATAVGSGSLVGSWMNDSGFWIYSKLGGVSESQTLRSWSPALAVCGIAGFAMTWTLAMLLPLQA